MLDPHEWTYLLLDSRLHKLSIHFLIVNYRMRNYHFVWRLSSIEHAAHGAETLDVACLLLVSLNLLRLSDSPCLLPFVLYRGVAFILLYETVESRVGDVLVLQRQPHQRIAELKYVSNQKSGTYDVVTGVNLTLDVQERVGVVAPRSHLAVSFVFHGLRRDFLRKI